MHDALYEQLADVEDRLWWHQSRRELIRSVLRDFDFPNTGVALDIGCGTGGTLPVLGEFASWVIGLDRSAHAIQWARRKNPGLDLRECDANDLESHFDPESFDLITLLNVLEHTWIPHEERILEQVFRLLRARGVVLITSAAFNGLARRHDRLAMSQRRHTLPTMTRFLEQAGFTAIRGTYFNMCSLPLAWLSARWHAGHRAEKLEGRLRELTVPPRAINEGMKALMACERSLGRLLGRLPFGVSLLCAGQKAGEALLKSPATIVEERTQGRSLLQTTTAGNSENRSRTVDATSCEKACV